MSTMDPPSFPCPPYPFPPLPAPEAPDGGQSPWQDEDAPRLTVADAAIWARCCEQTIRRAIQAKELIAHRWGKEYRMSPADLRQWYAAKLTQRAEQQCARAKAYRSVSSRRRS